MARRLRSLKHMQQQRCMQSALLAWQQSSKRQTVERQTQLRAAQHYAVAMTAKALRCWAQHARACRIPGALTL